MADYKSKTTPEQWEKRYDTASGLQTKMFKRFANWYDSLYAVVGTTASPWRSKVYVPILARQTWALVAKFLAIKPGFQIRVNNAGEISEEVDQQAEKARRKLEYDYENPYMDETMRDKLFAPLLDAVVTGTGLAKVVWRTEKIDRYERVIKKDGTVDLTKEKKTTKKVTYNDIEPVNIFNVYVSAKATNLYNAPWIIIKEHKTVSELKKTNQDAGVEIYKNLDKLGGGTSFDDDSNSYNFSRNRLMNQNDQSDSTVDMVTIYECYEGDTICTYAESSDKDDSSWVLLREQKNPYWHGKYPLVKFHVKARPFQFWGEGIFETTYRLQASYNDVFNHFMDQWNLAENSMLIVPERANVNDYVVEPGGMITYRGDTAPQQFKHSEPNPAALQTILTLMDQAVEGVTISQYAAGIPNSSSDNTKGTAHGIADLQQAAGDIVSFMRNNFTQSIVQIGRMWLSNNQQYMDTPIQLTVTNKGQKESMTVRPEDMQGDLDLTVDDSTMNPANQDEREARFIAYLQELQQLQRSSLEQAQATRWTTSPLYLDFASLIQQYSEIRNETNYDRLLLPKDQVDKAMQQSQTPMIAPNERVNLQAGDLLPSEMAQLLQRNGIQPDPTRMQGNTPVNEQATAADITLSNAKAQQALQPQPQQSSQNPSADQATVDIAHQLAAQGHVHPGILDHLPPLQPTPPELAQQETANV